MAHAHGPDPQEPMDTADRRARGMFFVVLTISLFGLLGIAAASTVLG